MPNDSVSRDLRIQIDARLTRFAPMDREEEYLLRGQFGEVGLVKNASTDELARPPELHEELDKHPGRSRGPSATPSSPGSPFKIRQGLTSFWCSALQYATDSPTNLHAENASVPGF